MNFFTFFAKYTISIAYLPILRKTITKIKINGLAKFNFKWPFYVIFVIVMPSWKIWCGFLIVNGLVFVSELQKVEKKWPSVPEC